MKKIHLKNPIQTTNAPYCGGRVDMARNGFEETEDKSQVTCRLCLMRMGVLEDTRGNWDNRTR